MGSNTLVTKSISLDYLGVKNARIHYQLSPEKLQELTVAGYNGKETNNGTLVVNTGEFTGRSPRDRFIVKDDITSDRIWWGDINIPFSPEKFDALQEKVIDYLAEKDVYVRDAYACAHEKYKLNIRVVNEYPWSNMFAYNMFLRPDDTELENFDPEWTVINAPGFMADPAVDGTRQHNFAILNFTKKIALIGNVILNADKTVDFADTSITQNTRVSYPIHHIENIKVPSMGSNPKNIFFLTADAFGVLPPISKLTPAQAAYHFISGYTAKVAGTEAGITEPVPSFSACFGAPFMPLHPTKYAEMLSKKMQESGVTVWLVNTGWTGGPYGVGHRMKLKYTRAMISAAMDGSLEAANKDNYHVHSMFGVMQPRTCPNVPTEVLSPRKSWNNDEGYYATAAKLTQAFRSNFKKFEEYASEEIISGGPLK